MSIDIVKNKNGKNVPPVLSPEKISEKRDLFVTCAINILERDGINALTLRHLANVAGVSRTTPYLYFKDKSALLEAMKIYGFNLLADACAQATVGHDSHVHKMKLLGETYVKFAIERAALYQLIFVSDSHDEASEPLRAAMDRYQTLVSAPTQKAYDEGIISISPERLGPVLWSATHGLLTLRNAGLLGNDEAFKQVQSDLNHVLALGFVTPRPAQENPVESCD